MASPMSRAGRLKRFANKTVGARCRQQIMLSLSRRRVSRTAKCQQWREAAAGNESYLYSVNA